MEIGAKGREDARLRQEIVQFEQAILVDPNNASFHATLAEKYLAAQRIDEAIHEFRTAINLTPYGPMTGRWKSHLRSALEVQAGHDKLAFSVCHRCEADVPKNAKVCPRCHTRLQMGFLEWLVQPKVLREVGRETVIVTMIIVTLLTIFSSLPFEWKACVLCATVIVGAHYLLKGIGGGGIG